MAREGLILILSGLVLTVIFIGAANRFNSYILFGISLVLAILTIFTTFFFRDPDEAGVIVSPADGKIVKIVRETSHPFLDQPATRISIFLSIFDVHINRIPADGIVEYIKYKPGSFLAAFKDSASEVNEQNEIGLITPDNQKMVFTQIAGVLARRIICNIHEGDTVKAGDRFGMIRFGSRTDIYLPEDCEIEVEEGQQVYGGKSVIGYRGKKSQADNKVMSDRKSHGEI
jgi:phosphatidylserine decarboxylase